VIDDAVLRPGRFGKKRYEPFSLRLVSAMAYQPANNDFFLITNQHQPSLSAQKPTIEQVVYLLLMNGFQY